MSKAYVESRTLVVAVMNLVMLALKTPFAHFTAPNLTVL